MKCPAFCPVVILLVIIALSGRIINATHQSCSKCLILTPYIKNGNASLARNLSEVKPDHFHGIMSYSGFITVKKEYNSNLFFWFFPAISEPMEETPWLIWLGGGPGFSSMMALFDLNGPLQIEGDKVIRRNVTWASDYSMLFIDNPVGAGYSFTDDDRGYPDNEDDIGEQLLELLQQFLEMFPELRSVPLFVTGESYAGKYVPAIALQIHRRKDPSRPINLKGIAIGNGLIDPKSMMHYSELCGSLGLLEGPQIVHLKSLENEFIDFLDDKRMVDAANKFNETIEYIKKYTGVNIYNFNEDPSSEVPAYIAYITRPDVRAAIHAGNNTFNHNNQLVYYKMLPDFANSTKPFVEELLEHYGVMSYMGQLDLILPYGLTKYMYEDLHWSQRDQYLKASRKRLRRFANGSVVAYKKSGGNFVDVVIRRAGHMVPKNQPEVAKFVLDRFIEDFK